MPPTDDAAPTAEPPRRIASHDDDPDAPFADRLLLALGISPAHVAQVGEQAAIDAAVLIKTDAHKFPMLVEDFSEERATVARLTADTDTLTRARDKAAALRTLAVDHLDGKWVSLYVALLDLLTGETDGE